jgi:hypothetical protein
MERQGDQVGEDKARVGEREQTLEMCIFPIGDLLAQAQVQQPHVFFF